MSDEDNSMDRVGEACVPNLRAECTSAGRGNAERALEEKREKIYDESRCAIVDACHGTAKNAR